MENTHTLPLLPLRNLVVFPHTQVSFDAVRPKSVRALDEAMRGDKLIFLVTQADPAKENPSVMDLYKIGIIAKVTQTVRTHNGMTRVMAEGLCRARLAEILSDTPYCRCVAEEIPEEDDEHMLVNEGFIRGLENVFDEYFALNKNIPPQNFITATGDVKPGRFADAIAANVNLKFEVKQEILEELDQYDRVEKIMTALAKEIQVLKISREIEKKVKRNIDANQREYYLREEMKVIEEELGEREGIHGEAEAYRSRVEELNLSEDVSTKLNKDIDRFEKMQSSSPDGNVMRSYLDMVLDLPWNKASRETLNIDKAKKILDADHYGMEKVKERALEYLAVHKLTGGKDGTILCLAGPPGTGKTSIAKSIARALGRTYVRVSLGGIHDEADIRGHRKTYVGAMPGRVISAVNEAGVNNPLILFDEIDKMGTDYRGDPSAALLEVLDSEQNGEFRDHYVEVPFDLSGAMFITTANDVSQIPEPLLDRIEVIEVSGYTAEEKKCIAKQYLIPRQKKKNGLSGCKLTIDDSAVSDLISFYTRESGVRMLEREVSSLMRKAAKKVVEENKKSLKITSKNLTDYLGRHRFSEDAIREKSEVGVARGLAWTSVGGDTLSIEVNVMPGTGKLELTGNLGDVMKESAMAAVSYIRTRCNVFDIYEKFYKTCDIHIHVPEGAVPKDGPSAGITMATAIVSALTGYPVRNDVAMTGEITLRGRVLPIGGLKEKSAAAYRAGVKTVIIPSENKPDLEDVTQEVKDNINFVSVSDMDEVLKTALADKKSADCFVIPHDDEEK